MRDETFAPGPAMRRLTALQQRYVYAMFTYPFGNQTKWAKLAGYSDSGEAAKVRGHFLSHDPKIEAAVNELAARYMTTVGPVIGISVMMRVARDPKHPKQLRAAEMLANRSGFHEKTEHKVSVHHTDDAGSIEGRIRQLAERLGIEPERLLGGGLPAKPPALIDITPEKASE